MCVFKYHAFIYFLRPPPWYGTPMLFTMESCDSPHHFGGESPFVSNICINFRMSFDTESQYSPYWLLRRVTSPRLIYSRESLLTAESYFQKLWRTPPSFKGTMKKKWTIHVEYCSPRTFQKSKKYGFPKALFFYSSLELTAGSWLFYRSKYSPQALPWG